MRYLDSDPVYKIIRKEKFDMQFLIRFFNVVLSMDEDIEY